MSLCIPRMTFGIEMTLVKAVVSLGQRSGGLRFMTFGSRAKAPGIKA